MNALVGPPQRGLNVMTRHSEIKIALSLAMVFVLGSYFTFVEAGPNGGKEPPTNVETKIDTKDLPLTSETRARQIANTEFLRYTQSKVKKFSIRKLEESKKTWTFSFRGEEEFLLPGYHWFVIVEKESGKASTVAGE
jgi:hypothetical protein